MSAQDLYCIDTSAILDGWTRYYPPDVLPDLWDVALPRLVQAGRLIASEVVFEELSRKDDGSHAWCKGQKGLSVPIDSAVQERLVEVMAAFPRFVNDQSGRNAADPWVVALARQRDAVVVTGERKGGKPQRPTIPLVCQHFAVPCLSILDLLRAEGWRFGLHHGGS